MPAVTIEARGLPCIILMVSHGVEADVIMTPVFKLSNNSMEINVDLGG
jgi:hypothetical protein